ncbi:MAG: 50S ribosomal protein L1 [Planctomycetota bacterium]
MPKRSKRYRGNAELVDRTQVYSIDEAIKILKKAKPAKFDETIEIALKLGIDVKKSDQMVRGAVSLPRGIGQERRVICFAKGEKAEEARAAGAIAVGDEDLAKRVQDGWLDFDVAVATPDMMRVVGKLGKVLGPQGKMPSPKSGTVTSDVAQTVREFRAGKVEFRADGGGNIHGPVGKRSFDEASLRENIEAFINFVKALKPSTARGQFIQKTVVSTTMGPGVPLDAR